MKGTKKKDREANLHQSEFEEYDIDSLATRVKELRESKNWNQAQLAEKAGVTRSQVTRLESGETRNINLSFLIALAKAFGVSTDYLLCLTRHSRAQYASVEKLGLSEIAAKRLATGKIDHDVLNRLLEHKEFPALCDTIREYFDDHYTEGYMSRNAILDYGITSLKQYSIETGVNTRDAMQELSREKIGADEINTERITVSFKRILSDIRKGIREKEPTSKSMTSEALEVIQGSITDKPANQVSPDDIVDGMMKFIDQKNSIAPGSRKMIERFLHWFMRTFSGKNKYRTQEFEAYQELNAALDETERKDKPT